MITATVKYRDGTSADVEIYQSDVASWELYALRMGIPAHQGDAATPIVSLHYLIYSAVHRDTPQKEWPDFAEWRFLIGDVDLDEEELRRQTSGEAAPAQTPTFPQVRSAG